MSNLNPESKITFRRSFATFTMLLFFAIVNAQYYYSYLNVLDPQKGWPTYSGNIDEAKFIIEPKGIYASVEMYLTFSAYQWPNNDTDKLEVQCAFALPIGSIVCDSWLLINDKWEKALLLDRWTATSIYEGIVQRRRDPSILTKESANGYKLNVYPMIASESRSVKISFMVPFTFSYQNASIELPFNLIGLSATATKTTIYVNESLGIMNPRFANNQSIEFTESVSTEYPNAKQAYFAEKVTDGILAFDSPLKNGIFATKYVKDNKGIYQLAFLPSQMIEKVNSKKVLILINSKGKSTITTDQITNGLKNMLSNIMTTSDSFNIFFSGLKTKSLSNSWLSTDPDNIETTFGKIKSTYYSNYGNLTSLFVDGLNYVKNEKNVSILLLSDSYEFDNLKSSNSFIEDLNTLFPSLPSISIIDYYTDCYYWWTSGSNFCGNSYLYGVISRATGGAHHKLEYNESFNGELLAIGQTLDCYIPTFDQITTLDNGFCYGRKLLNSVGNQVYANKPIMTIGKYKGTFPMNLQVSGLLNDSLFSNNYIITDEDALNSDSTAEIIWAGNYIEEMENSTSLQNEEVSAIIQYSIENRILSKYTAFLTLEPNMDIEPCEECIPDNKNDDIVTSISVKPAEKSDDVVKILPNPFTKIVKINIRLSNPSTQLMTVAIYNSMGQLVKNISLQCSNNGEYEVSWNGKDNSGKDVPKGTYFVKITSGDFVKNIKIVKL